MKKILIFSLSFLFLVSGFSAHSNAANTPKEFVEQLADKAVAIIKTNKTDKQKEADLINLFKQNVDTDFMARFAMGKFFRQATPEQQKKYLGLYRDYVIYLYIPKFKMYSGESLQVMQVIKDVDALFTVKTTLKTDKSSTGTVLVDYKIKQNGNSYKIIDVIGEGISLITTQRSDFATPLSEMGIDNFITRLSQKVDALKKNPDPTINTKKS